jgi:hypothetical protein
LYQKFITPQQVTITIILNTKRERGTEIEILVLKLEYLNYSYNKKGS